MPLTHVCMWSEHGWKRVSAEQATRHGASGTVSARSGLFMCELCGQYVTLAWGTIRDPYFKHSSEELSKDCEERTFSASAPTTFTAGSHSLPLRLRILSSSQFELQIGLLPVPNSLLSDKRKIIILSSGLSSLRYEYATSRIVDGTITYLSVGSVPAPNYQLSLVPADSRLNSYWPGNLEGISRSGSLFDSVTGKKLPYDADTLVNHKYWLLTPHSIYQKYSNVSIQQICRCSVSYSSWYVYEVEATAFKEDAARFFLDYHCRLTENAVAITPVWPVYVETPYVLRHYADRLAVFLRGDADPKVFPVTYLQTISCEGGQLFFVNCKERQQILSAGRTKVLQYTYLWKDPLDASVPFPEVEVTNLNGDPLPQGEQTTLPVHKTVVVTAPFDGYVNIKKCSIIIEKYRITSGQRTVIDKLQNGHSIEVFQGHDLAWRVSYVRTVTKSEKEDKKLLYALERCGGQKIAAPHTLAAIAGKLASYPLTRQWIYICIRTGNVYESAYRILAHYVTNMR